MSLILRQVIGYEAGKRASGVTPTADPRLNQELRETKQQLAKILTKWKFGDVAFTTADQFINKFAPWVEEQVERKKELTEFLSKYSASNLTELGETWTNTEEDYLKRIEELESSRTFTYEETDDEVPFPSRQKLTHDLEQAQQEIARLKENPEVAELETERDELARDKLTLEQETLSLNNRLNLKQQEVTKKEQEITRLKKEKSDQATSLNKKLTELKKERTQEKQQAQKLLEELQKKYSKRSQQLDEEQCENNKLTNKIESLEEDIKILKRDKEKLLDRLADKYGEEEE
jgi:chromosome segregation ATPase